MLGIVLFMIIGPVALWLIYWCYYVFHFEKYLKSIPGPRLVPLFGNALEVRTAKRILEMTGRYYEKYKGNYTLYGGAQPFFFVCEPKDLEFLLKSTTILAKASLYRFFRNGLGDGLGMITGDKWRKHRKIITPAFHFQVLERFIDVFNEKSDILITILSEASKKGSFDIKPIIARCALDIICETAMGSSANAQTDSDSLLLKSVDTAARIAMERSASIVLSNDFLYPFTKEYREERDAIELIRNYSRTVANGRREEFLRSREKIGESVSFISSKKNVAFLDLLLEYSVIDPTFTQKDIYEEVNFFILAGYDTTALSVAYTLLELANNPDIQNNTYEELKTIFANDSQRNASYADLREMKYLEMVIKEALRMYPALPLIARALEEDTDFNGMVLPKGLEIVIPIYHIHNSKLNYKNPEKFDPERFTEENSAARMPFAYIPFGAGTRNCIGKKYAMLEMKVMISSILRNFELLPAVPAHKVSFSAYATLTPDNGVFLQLKRRQ